MKDSVGVKNEFKERENTKEKNKESIERKIQRDSEKHVGHGVKRTKVIQKNIIIEIQKNGENITRQGKENAQKKGGTARAEGSVNLGNQ